MVRAPYRIRVDLYLPVIRRQLLLLRDELLPPGSIVPWIVVNQRQLLFHL